jgi:glycosidase
MKKQILLLLILSLTFSCKTEQKEEIKESTITEFANPPEWAKRAIWYQIYAERFRNGDPSNDPKPEDLKGSYPGFVPEGWKITPWTQDWYQPDSYFAEVKGKQDMAGYSIENFGQLSRLRRYGGDLQGVMDKIDYLDSLGITAIYFNPLCEAPSDHNYDASAWRHIDSNFGPTPEEDLKTMEQETPGDPSTWKMTGADKLFVELIDKLHQRGIRVILDYSWNHTGIEFWAWKDILNNQANSKYKDWYWIESFDNPETTDDEFNYKGWFGVKDLPEIKETEYHSHIETVKFFDGDIYSNTAKQHIFNVAKKWLDPNGDGDPSDGVDGFRLDVAAELPLGFWRDFRKEVRAINTDAYLLGEIWWEQWPDKLLDPKPVLEGDIFDAVMNYRWYRAARRFFGKAPKATLPSEFVDSLKSFSSNLRPQNNYAMMNLAASHDSPRLSTSLYNDSLKYKYMTEPSSNENYKINKPDNTTRTRQKLLLAHQYTYIGAPHIWAGDEMGMWGADMGDTRKPLIWENYEFEPEVIHPLGHERSEDEVKFDRALFNYYKKLIDIRKRYDVLNNGKIEFVLIDDENATLAYSRFDESNEVITVFNNSTAPKTIQIPLKLDVKYAQILGNHSIIQNGNSLTINLPASSVSILEGNN